ncbi:hypothetical protein AK812_SmicGene36147 [Symbiodinium microadriaticum]|uniref:Uncharacterized protein n=1 Tax=Symbiodinium microadriaticum TaxID=2951 RepID=A0A1Q9CJL8_SYMMI|nr:hypothetical protein AK812_SmicGene36147 [Symbiodinium microadriaticum]
MARTNADTADQSEPLARHASLLVILEEQLEFLAYDSLCYNGSAWLVQGRFYCLRRRYFARGLVSNKARTALRLAFVAKAAASLMVNFLGTWKLKLLHVNWDMPTDGLKPPEPRVDCGSDQGATLAMEAQTAGGLPRLCKSKATLSTCDRRLHTATSQLPVHATGVRILRTAVFKGSWKRPKEDGASMDTEVEPSTSRTGRPVALGGAMSLSSVWGVQPAWPWPSASGVQPAWPLPSASGVQEALPMPSAAGVQAALPFVRIPQRRAYNRLCLCPRHLVHKQPCPCPRHLTYASVLDIIGCLCNNTYGLRIWRTSKCFCAPTITSGATTVLSPAIPTAGTTDPTARLLEGVEKVIKSGQPEELSKTAEAPKLPELSESSSVDFGDWFYFLEPVMSDLSALSAEWWSVVTRYAQEDQMETMVEMRCPRMTERHPGRFMSHGVYGMASPGHRDGQVPV